MLTGEDPGVLSASDERKVREMDVLVVGAGPAGVFAARRAAELGAKRR